VIQFEVSLQNVIYEHKFTAQANYSISSNRFGYSHDCLNSNCPLWSELPYPSVLYGDMGWIAEGYEFERGAIFTWVKPPESKADSLPQTNTEIKNT
jgi:hypothetical protein